MFGDNCCCESTNRYRVIDWSAPHYGWTPESFMDGCGANDSIAGWSEFPRVFSWSNRRCLTVRQGERVQDPAGDWHTLWDRTLVCDPATGVVTPTVNVFPKVFCFVNDGFPLGSSTFLRTELEDWDTIAGPSFPGGFPGVDTGAGEWTLSVEKSGLAYPIDCSYSTDAEWVACLNSSTYIWRDHNPSSGSSWPGWPVGTNCSDKYSAHGTGEFGWKFRRTLTLINGDTYTRETYIEWDDENTADAVRAALSPTCGDWKDIVNRATACGSPIPVFGSTDRLCCRPIPRAEFKLQNGSGHGYYSANELPGLMTKRDIEIELSGQDIDGVTIENVTLGVYRNSLADPYADCSGSDPGEEGTPGTLIQCCERTDLPWHHVIQAPEMHDAGVSDCAVMIVNTSADCVAAAEDQEVTDYYTQTLYMHTVEITVNGACPTGGSAVPSFEECLREDAVSYCDENPLP